MRLWNFSILSTVFIVSCTQNQNPKNTNEIRNKEDKGTIENNSNIIIYNYDSITYQKCNYYGDWDSEPTDSFYILSVNSVELIKPYLKDSSIQKYSCCPEHISGFMTVYSDGKAFRRYQVAADGGLVGEEFDSLYTFLVPFNYQTRIKIPKKQWDLIISDIIRIKVPIDKMEKM
ncbi:MAG: hypothetical protein K1X56_14770 [Flavobacteriales bacterium]|nr:hypothetical protein [Flavobacteriales bacterium]